jgi:hypothetical protein
MLTRISAERGKWRLASVFGGSMGLDPSDEWVKQQFFVTEVPEKN